MTTQESFDIMDGVFMRGSEEDQRGLLKLIQEYFQSEAEKHAAAEKEKAKAEVILASGLAWLLASSSWRLELGGEVFANGCAVSKVAGSPAAIWGGV